VRLLAHARRAGHRGRCGNLHLGAISAPPIPHDIRTIASPDAFPQSDVPGRMPLRTSTTRSPPLPSARPLRLPRHRLHAGASTGTPRTKVPANRQFVSGLENRPSLSSDPKGREPWSFPLPLTPPSRPRVSTATAKSLAHWQVLEGAENKEIELVTRSERHSGVGAEDEGESTFEGRPGPPLDVPSPRARAARVEVRVASDAMM
jgi:hypothetical protein